MRVIIIDDEPKSHQVFKNHFKKLQPQVHVVANGYSISEGKQVIEEHQPDLVFLDIELPDGLGFDLISQISNPSFIVIFITAHNKYAQQAIQYGALDFLLKPIGYEELQKVIQKGRDLAMPQFSNQQIQVMLEAFQRLQQQLLPVKIAISTSTGILYRKMTDIVRLEADGNYTHFHFNTEEKPVLASLNIGSFEQQFEHHPHFMKVHRSSIVNLHLVDSYVRAEGGYLLMIDKSKVSVSRVYRDEVLKRLSNL